MSVGAAVVGDGRLAIGLPTTAPPTYSAGLDAVQPFGTNVPEGTRLNLLAHVGGALLVGAHPSQDLVAILRHRLLPLRLPGDRAAAPATPGWLASAAGPLVHDRWASLRV